ncbi:MAG: hypothetical protein NXI32_10780 [bacterium]|nr:hypothetical protein [bacterium]
MMNDHVLNLLADLTLPDIPVAQLLTYVGVATAVVVGLSGLLVLSSNRRKSGDRHHSWLSLLAYAAFMLVVLVLAISSFGALIQNGHLDGYALMAHIAAAGAFVFLLLVVAFLFLPTGAAANTPGFTSDNRWWLTRWSAWALILASCVTAGTMLLSMLPWFGTQDLLWVASIHRYAGLAVVVSAVFHIFGLVCTRQGFR